MFFPLIALSSQEASPTNQKTVLYKWTGQCAQWSPLPFFLIVAAKFIPRQNTMYQTQSRTPTAWKTAKDHAAAQPPGGVEVSFFVFGITKSAKKKKKKITKENSRQQMLVEQYFSHTKRQVRSASMAHAILFARYPAEIQLTSTYVHHSHANRRTLTLPL